MYQSLVSIIVPCYKQAEYLSETLDSVLDQTYQHWECVIVNDGSPDNTEEVAKRYLEKDQRFKYVCQENQGVSSARNLGIENSVGEYILPLDADDLIGPSYLEKAVRHFKESPETKLVYCKAEKFGKVNIYWDLPPYEYEKFIWDNCIFCSAMYRHIDYDKTAGYNVNMVHGNEDWDFWLSLLKKNDTVFRIDEVLFYYRVKDVSRTIEMLKKYKEDSLVQLYNNHQEVYEPFMKLYCERIVINKMESQELIDLKFVYDEYERIRNSYAYHIGKIILAPFSLIRRIVGK